MNGNYDYFDFFRNIYRKLVAVWTGANCRCAQWERVCILAAGKGAYVACPTIYEVLKNGEQKSA